MEQIAKISVPSLRMDWTVSQRVTVQTKNVIMSKAAKGSQQVFFMYFVRCSYLFVSYTKEIKQCTM